MTMTIIDQGTSVLYLNDFFLLFRLFKLQAQFLSSGRHGDGLWVIPITFSLGLNHKRSFLLDTKLRSSTLSQLQASVVGSSSSTEMNEEEILKNLVIKVNVGQTGFYRVKYDDKIATQLKKAIKENSLTAADKFGACNSLIYFLEPTVFLGSQLCYTSQSF